jgi:putative peptide zinc metalloprotease protein
MLLPHLRRMSASAALRRPVVLVPVTTLALAGLLGTGLLVANAVDAPPTSPASAEATPSPAEASAAGSAPSVPEPTSAQATTTSGGDDNVAVAVNTKDGSTVYALRLKVVLTGADVVDSGNAAVAAASCADCSTVAIALEGVIVTGDAEVVAPQNIALAINSGCTNCSTLAYAYQRLQTVDGRVRLTGAGRRGIAELRRQLNGLRTSGLDIEAVRAEADRIAGEFAAILDTEVVPLARPNATSASPSAGDDPATQDATGAPSAAPVAVPSPSAPADPATPTPTPSATQTGTASPSPTAGG